MFVVDSETSRGTGGALAYGASAALAGVQKLIVLRGELIGGFDFSGVSEALRAFPPGTPVRGTASGAGPTVWGGSFRLTPFLLTINAWDVGVFAGAAIPAATVVRGAIF